MAHSRTADGIDHGDSILTGCFEAVVEKFEDGFMLCPLNWQGVSCAECVATFEERMKRGDENDTD